MEAQVNSQRPSRPAKTAYALVNVLLVVVLLGSALVFISEAVGVAQGGKALLGDRTLSVDAVLPQEQVRSLPPGVTLRHDPQVTLEVRDPSAAQRLLSVGMDVGPFVLLVGALWLLRGLARSVTEGDPFNASNVTRLRRLGFLLVLGAPAVELVNWALRLSLSNTLPADEFGDVGFPGASVPFVLLLAGLGAFVLAEVFAAGVRLREDVEGTV
jgi:hypothetical protein